MDEASGPRLSEMPIRDVRTDDTAQERVLGAAVWARVKSGSSLRTTEAPRPQVYIETVFQLRDRPHVWPRTAGQDPNEGGMRQLALLCNFPQCSTSDLCSEREREAPGDFACRIKRGRIRPRRGERMRSRSLSSGHDVSLDARHRVDHADPEVSLRRSRLPPRDRSCQLGVSLERDTSRTTTSRTRSKRPAQNITSASCICVLPRSIRITLS